MSDFLKLVEGVLCKPRIKREVAFLIDLLICCMCAVFPGMLGKVAAVSYFLLRDGFPTKRQSWGKRIYDIRVVHASNGRRIGLGFSFLRNLLCLFPGLNIYDAWIFVRDGRRLYDKWLNLDVIDESESESQPGDAK